MSANLLAKPGIRRLIQATAQVYEQALDSPSISYEIPSEMRQKLEEDIFVFSGFKTYHQLKEASLLLRDDAGNIKPFSKFYQDVTKIKEKYNRNWLRAEYNFATASAEMASHWAEYATHKEYTNLQYHTALDDKVRESHAALEGITLPYEDSFWNTAFPPNGWNCRCHVVPVLKEDFPVSNSQTAQQSFKMLTEGSEIFRFNPGKEAVIFPPHHPYYGKQGYRHCLNPHLAHSLDSDPSDPCLVYQKIKEAEEVVKPTPLGKVLIEKTKDGHTIQRYENVDTEASDYKQVLSVARYFAKRGEDVELLPKMRRGKGAFEYKEVYADLIGTRYEGKTPDLRCTKDGVSVYREVKGYNVGTQGKRALKNMLNRALEQSDRIIIQRHPDWTDNFIARTITNRIRKGIEIQEVWLIEPNNELTLVYKKTEG